MRTPVVPHPTQAQRRKTPHRWTLAAALSTCRLSRQNGTPATARVRLASRLPSRPLLQPAGSHPRPRRRQRPKCNMWGCRIERTRRGSHAPSRATEFPSCCFGFCGRRMGVAVEVSLRKGGLAGRKGKPCCPFHVSANLIAAWPGSRSAASLLITYYRLQCVRMASPLKC